MVDFKKSTLELIQMGEGLTVEFKRTIDSPFKIAKTLASFANTSGGILLVGIADNRSTVGHYLGTSGITKTGTRLRPVD